MPRSDGQAKRLPDVQPGWRSRGTGRPGWIVAACAVLLCAVTLGLHAQKYPDFSSFWAGVDQQRYLQSARAWAHGDLSPARHHYPPFYPLMGAAFVWLTPWQPFMLPDLACLLAGLVIFMRIGRRLAPGWPASAFAACFTLAVLSGRADAAVWLVPWSTTGSAPFQFLAVLLALRFAEVPGARRAGLFGLAVALVAGFRPSDAAVLLASGGAYAVWALLRHRLGIRVWAVCAGAGAIGLLLGLVPAIGAHLAVFGFSAGPYVSGSAATGLEWRLLPMRWVMIVIGARPLLPEGLGLAVVLPWVAPGLAGMVLGLLCARRRGAAWVLVAGTVALHWMLYLTYRDLQPYGLWRFYNFNYFKWTFPFLVLAAAQLLPALASRHERRPAIFAALVTALLFLWRPVLRDGVTLPVSADGQTITLSDNVSRLDQAIRLPLRSGWNTLYFGSFLLHAGGEDFINKRDFKILPVPAGALLLPLRRLPAGPATLLLPAGVTYNSAEPAETFRQGIVFGLPCVVFRPACG